jgi:hypothetical protein
MYYHLSCERLLMAGLDDCNILHSGHIVRNRLGGMHDSISIQNLISHIFACSSSLAMSRVTKEYSVPNNPGGSRSWNVRSGELRLHAARPWHYELVISVENLWLDKLSKALIWVFKGLLCSMNSAHDAHSLEH